MEVDPANSNPLSNKVGYINLHLFHELAYVSYLELRNRVSNSQEITLCKNIYDHLLHGPDGLEDGMMLERQYQKLVAKGIVV